MKVQFGDITITSLETLTAFHVTSGAFKWVLDELQDATIANTQEETDITGKQGRLLNTLKKNKSVTISGNNGLLSGGLMETQVGGTFENKVTPIMFPDYQVVTGNKSKTAYKAVGTLGKEIRTVAVRNVNGSLGKTFEQGDAVATGVFTYDPATKELVFAEGEIADGTEIVIYYNRKINGDVLENISDHYSEKVSAYLDAFGEDRCGKVVHVQFYFPKLDFNGNFDITMGGDQSVHAFEARSLAGACGASGSLWTYTVFGMDAEDAA